MTRHVKQSLRGDYGRLALTALVVFAAAYLLLSSTADRSVASAEARFSDTSVSGLALVPASGGSESSYTGSYTGTYTGSYTPAESSYTPATGSYTPATGSYTPGTSSYVPGTGSYSPGTGSYTPSTGSYTPSTCWDGSAPVGGTCPPCPVGYTQVGNACVPPTGPQFVGFTTTQGFNASGHLEVRPSLVRTGDTSRVYWSVTNVRDCTVRGSNGDGGSGSVTGVWNTTSSGASGLVTGPITSRTDYTLFCHSLTGATPSTITETRTVNVLPSWYEPSGTN